jgi:hypothetical protein
LWKTPGASDALTLWIGVCIVRAVFPEEGPMAMKKKGGKKKTAKKTAKRKTKKK